MSKKLSPDQTAAWYLIVAGMKVAEADGAIVDKELATLQKIMQGASTIGKSAFVRRVASLAADGNTLDRNREKDNRDLTQIISELSENLNELPNSDRMRYLGLLIVTVKEVATSTGGGWFRKRSLNDSEVYAATGMISAVAGGLDPNFIIDWVEANGY
jgi:hypothetical protein